MYHYVVRTNSGVTAQIILWKVLSSPFTNEFEAKAWLNAIKMSTSNRIKKKHRFFIVSSETETL